MQTALANESNPMDADLERVLPGVHQRLNAHHSLLVGFQQDVDYKMDRLTQTVASGFEKVTSITENWKAETDKMIGCTLVEAGTNLLRQSSPMSPGGASVESHQPTRMTQLAWQTPSQSKQSTVSTRTTTSSPDEHSRYRMQMKHPTLLSVWKEWFGLDEYYDEFGGIDGRNKLHGTKWRKHLNGTSYSKVSQLIKGINANAETNGMQPESVIAEWEGIFTACKHSANNMVKALQSLGKLKKLKQRGKIVSHSQD